MILTVPDGRLSSTQLKAVAKVAAEQGRDFADLTTRQEIRLPGIPSEPPPELLQLLAERGLSSQIPSEDPPQNPRDPIGVLEQEEAGLFTLGMPVLAGRLSGNQMRKAADVAERYGDGSLRLTTQQNLVIPGVAKEKVAQALEALDGVGLRVSISPICRGLICCSAEKGMAMELVGYLEKQVPLDEPLGIHVSDSACSCPQAPAAQIRLEGVETCDLTAGGFTALGIPARQVKYRLEKLLVGYKKNRCPSEVFVDFCRRVGDEELARLLSDDREEIRSR